MSKSRFFEQEKLIIYKSMNLQLLNSSDQVSIFLMTHTSQIQKAPYAPVDSSTRLRPSAILFENTNSRFWTHDFLLLFSILFKRFFLNFKSRLRYASRIYRNIHIGVERYSSPFHYSL